MCGRVGTLGRASPPILKESESGVEPGELCRRHGITRGSLYRWKAKYGRVPQTSTQFVWEKLSGQIIPKRQDVDPFKVLQLKQGLVAGDNGVGSAGGCAL